MARELIISTLVTIPQQKGISVQAAQFTARQVLSVLKRRRKFLFSPIVLVTGLCVLGAYLLPNKYESGVTVLVQQDEILNPLVSYEMAVTMATEDQLKTFNEVIYSKTTIQMLIDSLGLATGENLFTEDDRQELIKKVKKNIVTERPGATSFRIDYLDTDPVRAQRGVLLLSNYFIRTILQVENQRNELAVQFFESKLTDLRQRYEESEKQLISSLQRNIEVQPAGNAALGIQIEESEKQLGDIESHIRSYQQALSILQKFPEAMKDENGKQSLYDIARMDIPYAYELRPLLTKYEELTRRYTSAYPEVVKLNGQIVDMLSLIRSSIESELSKQRTNRIEIERHRAELVDNLKRSSVSKQEGEGEQSNYDIYKKLYDDMQVKLEQAKTTRDLGKEGKNQFIIIDPPMVPTEPAKPNRPLIIIGGTCLGFLIGLLTAGTAELLDTTVRNKKDVEVYQKPVIAFVPDGTLESVR
ncbi:MAG TPA: GNVR domain-containing protein [Bacteroidota bacterium]